MTTLTAPNSAPLTYTGRFAVPGDKLYAADGPHESGEGTYTVHNAIHASLAGYVMLRQKPALEKGMKPTQVVLVRQSNSTDQTAECSSSVRHVMPTIGSVVTATITAMNMRYAKCQITDVGASKLPYAYNAQIRKEDVVSVGKDKVNMARTFRVGDIILAKVLSLGDSIISFNLTTAEEPLGVVRAKCEDGHALKAVKGGEWKWMECTVTGEHEPRKVARVPQVATPNQMMIQRCDISN